MESNNTAWGFYGTFEISGRNAAEAWAAALPVVAELCGMTPAQARDALDAKSGRHFADKVLEFGTCDVAARAREVLISDRRWKRELWKGCREVEAERRAAK